MSTARPFGIVPKVDHAEGIAHSLERLAADIRAGVTPVEPIRCLVILAGGGAGADDVGMTFLGAEASPAEVIGLLELAKIQTIDDA
jgi:hypothetical protein